MQFGYFTLTDNSPGYGDRRRDHSQFLREVIDEAIAAEELGFHSAWLPEHHFGLADRIRRTSLSCSAVMYRSCG